MFNNIDHTQVEVVITPASFTTGGIVYYVQITRIKVKSQGHQINNSLAATK